MIIDPKDIKKIRESLGVTQKKLAKLAGVSQSFIAKVEQGQIDPTYSKLKAISEALLSLMEGSKKVKDIMTSPVIHVGPNDSLSKVATLLEKNGISQVPVISGNTVLGMVSEADLVRCLLKGKDVSSTRAEEVMSAPPPIISAETPVMFVLPMLERFPAILIIENGEIKGIVTRADVIKLVKEEK